MDAHVSLTRCDRTGRCVQICPEVFQFQPGHKKAAVIKHPIPVRYQDAARRAAKECPQGAITVTTGE